MAHTMSKRTAYALNVITLACWLTAALGAVIGFSVHQEWTITFVQKPKPLSVMTSVDIAPAELSSSDSTESSDSESADLAEAESAAEPELMTIAAQLSAPPEMPELAPIDDMPEVPEMPDPVIKKTAQRVATPSAKPQLPAPNTSARAVAKGNSGNGAPSSATSLSFGSGAGRQPAPNYPLQARRSNQQGTVVIEFIVGVDGKVLSAWVKNPCPYDLLNNAALSTIRARWKFPAGDARRYKIPIVFRLN